MNEFSVGGEERKARTRERARVRELIGFDEGARPRVSVVVPVYNVEKYLPQCLESLLAQTLRDIEVICVNDGSTDGSLAVLRAFRERDGRVRIADKENAGYGNAVNLGIDLARGEYIGIVESDDYVLPKMFARLYRAAKRADADIVRSDFYEVREGSEPLLRRLTSEKYYGKVFCPRKELRAFTFPINTWNGIYRSAFLRGNAIRHNETPGASYQDTGFWFQTQACADREVLVREAFYCYRQDNPDSSVNDRSKLYCICDEFAYIADFLAAHPDKKTVLQAAYIGAKISHYLFAYRRLDPALRPAFFSRFSQEMREHAASGELALSETRRGERELMSLLDDAAAFAAGEPVVRAFRRLDAALRRQDELLQGKSYAILRKLKKRREAPCPQFFRMAIERLSSPLCRNRAALCDELSARGAAVAGDNPIARERLALIESAAGEDFAEAMDAARVRAEAWTEEISGLALYRFVSALLSPLRRLKGMVRRAKG